MKSPAVPARAAIVASFRPNRIETQRRGSRTFTCPLRVAGRRHGFTLVEILVATVIVLMMMAMIVTILGLVGDSVRNNRAMLETADRLRSTERRLQLDLQGATCTMIPPRTSADGDGYFEYYEGPVGPIVSPATVAFNTLEDTDGVTGPDPDRTFGDGDDVLMFTTRSRFEPFVGRYTYKRDVNTAATPPETASGNDAIGDFVWQTATMESPVAEVAWFLRGTTLYRRVLLVKSDGFTDYDRRTVAASNGSQSPTFLVDPDYTPTPFQYYNDLSVRQVGGGLDRSPAPPAQTLVPNSLGDLAKRENRFGHQPFTYPHDIRFWGDLRLPTIRECSHGNWPFPVPTAASLVQSTTYTDAYSQLVVPDGAAAGTQLTLDTTVLNTQWVLLTLPAGAYFDPWRNPFPAAEINPDTGALLAYQDGARTSEDVILTNVLSFDVKAYDPGALIIAAPGAVGDPPQVLSPGDAGYLAALAAGGFSIVGRGAYVDLNYMGSIADSDGDGLPDDVNGNGTVDDNFTIYDDYAIAGGDGLCDYQDSTFCGPGHTNLRYRPYTVSLRGSTPASGDAVGATYDTWSSHYERDGFDQDGDPFADEGSDGFDQETSDTVNSPSVQTATGVGADGVDDPYEQEAPPPYPVPLRGIQVKIRVFEPQSREIREVTITQSFQPG
jgi:prepilin-type N-terminal cleavage/methylation domain-containing protein